MPEGLSSLKRATRSWVRKAEGDIRAARQLAAAADPEKDAVAFHCQPAAEKYLKALLCDLGLHIPHIHELDDLLVVVLPHYPVLRSLRRFLVGLSRYAVENRYPGESAVGATGDMAPFHLTRCLCSSSCRFG